jgi:2-iminobutanoate/2-iminopropanoate deaminase
MMQEKIFCLKKLYMLAIALSSISACAPAKLRSVNRAPNAYAQAIEVTKVRRFVFVSGQIPVSDHHQDASADFTEQCKAVWNNIKQQLEACNMKLTDIVKVTTYLADRKYREQNYTVRSEVLGDHSPALTIIIADIYDEAWLLEIEVIAAR